MICTGSGAEVASMEEVTAYAYIEQVIQQEIEEYTCTTLNRG